MFEPGEDENEHVYDWEPDPVVTRELFLRWRDARRGEFPGENLTNPVWRWFIDSNISAYHGNDPIEGTGTADFDGELLDRLYDPPVPHEALVEHDWSERTRYVIDGVPLHFDEGMYSVLLTVVGELPSDMMGYYVEEVRSRLSLLEGVPYRVTKL